MALFGLFGKSKSTNGVRCKRGRGFTYEIVGEASYQPNLLALAGGSKGEYGAKIDEEAVLHPEPENPHDPNAVVVLIRKKKVGYIPRKDAPAFLSFLKKVGADSAACDAKIVGGWDDGDGNEGHFGVKLSLSWPPKTAS